MWIWAVSSYNLFCTIRDCLGLVFVYLFHLMMGSYYIYPTLSLSGLKNIQFTKGSSTHMVFASPSRSSSRTKAVSKREQLSTESDRTLHQSPKGLHCALCTYKGLPKAPTASLSDTNTWSTTWQLDHMTQVAEQCAW